MVSPGGRPWGRELRAPVAVAAVILAVAVWKSHSKAAVRDGDEHRSLARSDSGGSGGGSSCCSDVESGSGSHSKGAKRRRRGKSQGDPPKSTGKNSSSSGGGGGLGSSSGMNPPQRCCNCPAAIAATAAATALVRRVSGSGVVKSALAGTRRRGRHERRHVSAGPVKKGGGVAAIAGVSGGGGAGASAGQATASAMKDEVTVESVAILRRMCRFPGVILRSGLVFQRVAVLSMPKQGLQDQDIPESLVRLAGVLRKVDLSGNRLKAIPQGVLGLGVVLEDLNLGNNEIEEMPPEIAQLDGLLFFNMAGNCLKRLPVEVGKLSALKRLGLKGNALERLPSSIGDLSHLVELYLTGNHLVELPDQIVKLRRLKKLQMSFNNLRSLPPGMEAMRSLELCRLAVNPELVVVPDSLTAAERLSWVSLAGSAWSARATAKRRRSSFPEISRNDVVLGERLGSGASGDVFAGVYRGQDVAVKVFKSDVGPDGSARDELDVACTVDHPNLTKSLGLVRSTPLSNAASSGIKDGGSDDGVAARDRIHNLQWLVMERVVGRPLADKPDFSSVLRCRWGSGRRFEPVLVLAVLLQVSRAMSYLHEKAICHGDLYAHNVLVDGETGAAVLCDFGASFFYPSDLGDSFMLEGTEVRAFGLMARDMACRSSGCEWILQDLVPSCLQPDASHRPSFDEIINQLHAELMQSVEPSSPMVTSAKSLHSLLDRPDIAAERGRVLSAERRQGSSSSSSTNSRKCGEDPLFSRGSSSGTDAAKAFGGSRGGGGGRSAAAAGVRGGGSFAYKTGRNGGALGRGRSVGDLSVGGRLRGVEEGTADDEGGTEDGEGGDGEKVGKSGGEGTPSKVGASAPAVSPSACVLVSVEKQQQ